MTDLAPLLDLAVSVAEEAGRLLSDGRPDDLGVSSTKSSPTDVVTEMDEASERLIVGALTSARPDDGVLGEEGASREGTSGVRWVIDPIDGTVNYLYGYPSWAVSIAAELDGEAVVGVVHVPPLRTTFTAVRGEGAWQDGRPLRRTPPPDLSSALVATGFGYDAARRRGQGAVVAEVLPRVRDVRRAGSAAVDLCLVAAGVVDGYYEKGLKPWDRAAGALVAAEAGAVVGDLRGGPASETFVLAAPEPLFGQLRELLAGLDADAV